MTASDLREKYIGKFSSEYKSKAIYRSVVSSFFKRHYKSNESLSRSLKASMQNSGLDRGRLSKFLKFVESEKIDIVENDIHESGNSLLHIIIEEFLKMV